jgi:phosphopantothenoylcysteine decarboxylase/phosphopantothenate--cysteine ligase
VTARPTPGPDEAAGATPEAAGRRVLVGIGGGIAAYKAPELVRRLRERGFETRCAITRAAASFVAPLALEVVSGHPVHQEEYLAPGVGGEEAHIAAGEWADLLLVAPATAHLLARLALGLADDFLTTTALAFDGPLLLAPAMHPRMWDHPATQGHLATLAGRGARLVGPVVGPLASGETGMGRMAEPEEIAAAAALLVAPRGPLAGVRVLVSAGPTWEPLDPVRFLGNRSSGRMGFAVAAEAARRGAIVELVAGPVALPTPPGAVRLDVETAEQMRAAILERAPEADLVVMAAAVADYRPRAAAARKLRKEEGPPRVELEANADILAELGAQSGAQSGAPVLVGFAAETEEVEERAAAKLRRKGADFLVANDVSRHDIGFGSDWNEAVVLARDGGALRLPRQTKASLAAALLDHVTPAVLARRERRPLAGRVER